MFKFLNVNDRISLLWRSLEVAGPDLVAFIIFFFIVFIGFVVTGHLLFGTGVSDFRNFAKAFITLFKMLLGDFNYKDLEDKGNRLLAPIVSIFLLRYILIVNSSLLCLWS